MPSLSTRCTGAKLADPCNPLAMPPALLKARQRFDAAADAVCGRKTFKTDAERVAFLFELYQPIRPPLPAAQAPRRVRSAGVT